MMKSKVFFLVGILGLVALLASACAPGVPATTSGLAKEISFRFLVSDEANDIGDFEHLYVTIPSIGIHQGSDNGTWL